MARAIVVLAFAVTLVSAEAIETSDSSDTVTTSTTIAYSSSDSSTTSTIADSSSDSTTTTTSASSESSKANCTVPLIPSGVKSWSSSTCDNGAIVQDGTTCTITHASGYFCESPGLCSAGTFAKTGLCKAATELKGSLNLKVSSSYNIEDNSTLQTNIKQALAGFIQVPIEYIEIDISSARRLSVHLRRLEDDDVKVGYTAAIPTDGSAGNAADVQTRVNSMTAADLQGTVTAFDAGITVVSMTPVAGAGAGAAPAAPAAPAATATSTPSPFTTTPKVTETTTPGVLVQKLFHKDEGVANQSNAWVYPVFGLVAFLSLAGSVTIYMRSSRGSHGLPVTRTRELSRADDDDDEGLLAPMDPQNE